MILSFHPNIVAHENRLCAGRLPNEEDRRAISRAKAVILSQGCGHDLYLLCRRHCAHVFPNYDARFSYPGKLGQMRLFEQAGAAFPASQAFESLSACRNLPFSYPFVLKLNRGGEGEGVFMVDGPSALARALEKARLAQQDAKEGFLVQEYVPSGGRSLRVVVIGDRIQSYWRVQKEGSSFPVNLRSGAEIDHEWRQELQEGGRQAVQGFCSKTGINLAGLDLLFPEGKEAALFLEINYFFGRRGLGGSLAYYRLFEKAVAGWLEGLGLAL